MKKGFFLLLLTAAAFAESSSPLSDTKKEILQLKREQILRDVQSSQKSWLSPINLSASVNKNEDAKKNDYQINSVGVSWNQDLFRSGGITYTIENARASGNANLLGVDIEESTYLKQIYTYIAQIERDKLAVKQQKLTLANYEIDLFITQAKYKVGSADISQLNQAVINRNNSKNTLLNTQNTLATEIYELQKLTKNKNTDVLNLPSFPDITKEEYLANNLQLLQYAQNDIAYEASWKNTRSNYLPKLTLNASYAHQEYDSSATNYSGNPYSYGLTLSMPLDFSTCDTVESKRLQYLQTKTQQLDTKETLGEEYDKYQTNIKMYMDKIAIAEESEKMYKELYDFTKKQELSGFKSKYDTESLENSLKIQELEKEIQNYNITIQKISLYFDMRH